MSPLADVQAHVRRFVTDGAASMSAVALTGGSTPIDRLAIHHRHYTASLLTTIVERFPASAWLVGSDVVADAARAFVRQHPPQGPCISEYGDAFPGALGRHSGAIEAPYLQSFAELEWAIGQVSIAVEHSPMPWPALAALGAEELLHTGITMQPGIRYVRAEWAIDELMTLYLTDSAPDRFTLQKANVYLEVRGARGTIRFDRVDSATFAFRATLLEGASIGQAAEMALDHDETFDPGQALATAVAANLTTASFTATKGCNR